MFWLVFFLALFSNGYIIKSYIFPRQNIIFSIASLFALGAFFSVGIIYVLDAYVFKDLDQAMYFFLILCIAFVIIERKKYYFHDKIQVSSHTIPIVALLITLFFSWYIFSKTFTYDTMRGEFSISSNVYADMGIHIPFIRSFSIGSNVPAEVPIFGNKNLPYHFMTDYFAGILEHFGLRIDLAFNLMSTLAFTALLFAIYSISKVIFPYRLVGILSVLLFFCTNNFALFDFLNQQNSLQAMITSFWHNTTYYSAGPLGKDTIAVYWTMNTFVNQRQLIFGILFILLIIYFLLMKTHGNNPTATILLALVCSGIFFWNSLLFFALIGMLIGFIIFFPEYRNKARMLFFLSFVFAIPFLFVVSQADVYGIRFKPGFLISESFNILRFILFWLWNFGFVLLTFALGLILTNKENKKLALIFFIPFVIANVLQFGNDIANSHKLVNLALVFINIFAAYGLFWLYLRNYYLKCISLFIITLLFVSGLLTILVIKNDVPTFIYDYPSNSLMQWSLTHLPADQTLLTNGEIYDPMSLVGKKIFLGRTYYIASYGGDVIRRSEEKNILLKGEDPEKIKIILKENNIHYTVFYKKGFAKNNIPVNMNFYLNTFDKIYEDTYGIVFKI